MSKKQHRSQENLRNVALATAQKPDSKPQKKIDPTVVSIQGMDEFCPRAATSRLTEALKGNKIKLALIQTSNVSISMKKLKTNFGEPQRWRAATTNRKSFTGSKRDVMEWAGEAVALAWQKARGNA